MVRSNFDARRMHEGASSEEVCELTRYVMNSESVACVSHVEMPNPTGDDHKRSPQNNRSVQKEGGQT